jgi:hypothetical protein
MRVPTFVIGAVCISIIASPAWAGAKQAGDTGGIKGIAAAPQVKKLSPKGGAACFRACMHGMGDSVGWGNFCDYSCYGG